MEVHVSITLYTAPNCSRCSILKEFLASRGQTYTAFDFQADKDAFNTFYRAHRAKLHRDADNSLEFPIYESGDVVRQGIGEILAFLLAGEGLSGCVGTTGLLHGWISGINISACPAGQEENLLNILRLLAKGGLKVVLDADGRRPDLLEKALGEGLVTRLLLNILPVRVAEDLKLTGHTTPETFENVTVAFADLVGFTNLSAELEPKVLIDELNEIFTGFDLIIERNDCERIKTIGDAYLAVSGMNSGHDRHARNIADAALEMVNFLDKRNDGRHIRWQVRVGIHSGKVVGGVVGIKKYIYDVFGDTINTACRMEQNSEPMKINISEATRLGISDGYELVERGEFQVKGKGGMKMFFVTGRKTPGGTR